MKRSSLGFVSIFAVFCLSLIWLRPIQALDSQPPTASGQQSAETGSLQKAIAGRWTLEQTGDTIDITETDGKVTAAIGGLDWELIQQGISFVATRVLTREDAARLFPDIGDAPAVLSGKSARLVLALESDHTSISISLSVSGLGSGRRAMREVPLIAGSLTRPTGGTNSNTENPVRRSSEIQTESAGTPTMSEFPSPAPNAFGSPSFAPYTTNAISALGSGQAAVGNPAATPTAYFRVTSLDDRGNIVTGFPSWKGFINPGTAFGAAFSSELGNRVHFGLHILGNGTQFKLSNLQFHMHSSDAGDLFAFDGDFTGSAYSATRVGINYGPDHIKGTADDVTITSGPATQLVDELMYVGVGNALAPDDVTCTGSNQATVDCVKTQFDQIMPFKITTVYNLVDDAAHLLATSSSTVDFGNCVTLTCPANIVATAGLGQTSAAVTYAATVASSPCGETFQVSTLPASGSQFPIGMTTVTSTATDAAGNRFTCSFTVTVKSVVVKLQDIHSGDSLCFDAGAGAYTFTHCGSGGFTLTGTGKVLISGATVTLIDTQPGKRVVANFLTNQLTGHATVGVSPAPGISQTFIINSSNPNATCSCP
jgi:hypothetical protein